MTDNVKAYKKKCSGKNQLRKPTSGKIKHYGYIYSLVRVSELISVFHLFGK